MTITMEAIFIQSFLLKDSPYLEDVAEHTTLLPTVLLRKWKLTITRKFSMQIFFLVVFWKCEMVLKKTLKLYFQNMKQRGRKKTPSPNRK